MKKFIEVILFLLVARATGLAKEILLLSEVGVGEKLDLFVFITLVIISVAGFMSSIADNLFIPYFSNSTFGSRHKYVGPFFAAAVICSTLVGAITLTQSEAPFMLSCVASITALSLMGSSYIGASLMAKGRNDNSRYEFIPAMYLCIYLLVCNNPTINGLTVCFCFGAFCQLIAFQLLDQKFTNPVTPGTTHALNKKHVIFVITSQILVLTFPLLDGLLLLTQSTGDLSSYGFSVRIVGVLMTLFATAASRTIIPIFSKSKSINLDRIRPKIMSIFVGLLLLSILAFYIGIPITQGNISAYFSIQVLQLPFYVFNILMINLFVARLKYWQLLNIACLGLSSKVLFLIICQPLIQHAVIWSGVVAALVPSIYILVQLYGKNKGHLLDI